jgi:rhodanese-related sulfurtransferase
MSGLLDFFVEHWVLSALFLTLLGFYLTFEILYSHNNRQISSQLAVDLMNHQHAVVIDIRTKEAFEQGHIIDAVNIPHEQFMDNLKKIQKYAKKPVIIVCAVGKDSSKIVTKLIKEQDFTRVLQLSGGMHEWIASGFPIVHGKEKRS